MFVHDRYTMSSREATNERLLSGLRTWVLVLGRIRSKLWNRDWVHILGNLMK